LLHSVLASARLLRWTTFAGILVIIGLYMFNNNSIALGPFIVLVVVGLAVDGVASLRRRSEG